MNLKQLVLKSLKPKVSAYGFNKRELQGVATFIVDNLSYEENASEEEVQTAIADKIDELLPLLKLGQSQANRIINEKRAQEDDSEDVQSEIPEIKPSTKSKAVQSPISDPVKESVVEPKNEPKTDEQPQWAKDLAEQLKTLGSTVKGLSTDIGAFKAKEKSEQRTAKMHELLKDAGAYGESILSIFPRLSFKDEDEFNSYYDEAKSNLETFNKEQKEKGLEVAPPAGGDPKKEEVKEVTDQQLENIADMF